jgi:putative transposase
MPRKRYKAEEIVAKLRQVDVLVSQGQSVTDAISQIGVTEVVYVMSFSTERSSTL